MDVWRESKSRVDYKSNLQYERNKISRYAQFCALRLLRGCKNLPHSPITWTYLIVLGVISACFGSFMDYCANTLRSSRDSMSTHTYSLIWIPWCVSICLIASFFSQKLSSSADGSGIPHIKNILSGHSVHYELLSIRTLVAKTIGSILSIGSGLSVGKEGPFIHIASIVAHKLGRLEFFKGGSCREDYIRAGK